ncbi:NIN-like protein [Artemisia annua]|uniref:NIN-like protein n=1 Tax=Artemisia annua TaxID=35608 RepID=A0A2U1KBP1_ARTAN|nr:NIN-like protein [Artemisia annua]
MIKPIKIKSGDNSGKRAQKSGQVGNGMIQIISQVTKTKHSVTEQWFKGAAKRDTRSDIIRRRMGINGYVMGFKKNGHQWLCHRFQDESKMAVRLRVAQRKHGGPITLRVPEIQTQNLELENSSSEKPIRKLLLKNLKRECLNPCSNLCLSRFAQIPWTNIDVDNSTKSETKFFKIFKEKRLSPIPEAIDKGKKAMVVNYNARSKEKHDTTEISLSREDIKQHYGKTMKKAAKDLGVSLSTLKRKHNKLGMSGWQGPDLPQRNAYNSNKNQSKESHTHEKDNGVIQDPSPFKRNENTVIKAEYVDDIIKLHLHISEATFVTVENEIGKKFKLKHGTFKIKYLDEDEEWILMTSDQDLSDCIQNSRTVDRSAVRLRVLLHNQ